MYKRISILSCGWVGLALANRLRDAGYLVKGARTTEEGAAALTQSGLEGYRVWLSPGELQMPEDFLETDCLVIAVPPRMQRGNDAHTREMELLVNRLKSAGIPQLIFISSTAVYAATAGVVTEEDTDWPATPNGQALRTVETWLLDNFNATVLRPGGLVGYDRLPRASRLQSLPDTVAQPMNVVHRDDLVAVIERLVETPQPGEIFNVCAGRHPIRYAYYEKAAAKLGIALPPLPGNGRAEGKIVVSAKLLRMLNYRFRYDDPMELV